MRDFETPEHRLCDARLVWKKVYIQCIKIGYTDAEAKTTADSAADSFEEKFHGKNTEHP